LNREKAEAKNLESTLALGKASLGAISAVAATIEKRDPYTSGHQQNVALLAGEIAKDLGWSEFQIEGIRLGATIHDIGKIYVPAEILNRPGKLSMPEFDLIKTHPEVGYEILRDTEFPWPIREMVLQHHERIDGSGYPNGLTGDQMVDEAKVLAVADVVEAITSHRPYRPALGIEKGLEAIKKGRGTAYDPEIVDSCIRVINDQGFEW
jgi:putative nucleotidyltransferase with HDIG domain